MGGKGHEQEAGEPAVEMQQTRSRTPRTKPRTSEAQPSPRTQPDFIAEGTARPGGGNTATPSKPSSGRGRAWREDWILPVCLVGAAIAIHGALQLTTRLQQPFDHFVTENKRHLLLIAAGIALFMPGFLGRLSGVIGGAMQADGRRHAKPAPKRSRGRVWARRSTGVSLIAGGLGLLAYCLRDTYQTPKGLDGFAALLVSLPLCVAGVALIENRRRGWFADMGFGRGQRGLPWHRRDLPWLLLYLAAWFGACFDRIDTRPAFFTGDEALVSMYGRQTFAPQGREKQQAPWDNIFDAFGSCVPRGIAYKMTPDRPRLGPRLYTLCVSTVLMGVFFVLARSMAGRLAAWIALGLFSTSHAILYFARSGLTNLDSVLLICAWMLSVTCAWRSRRLSSALLAGLLAGMTHYTYKAGMIVLPITAAVLVITFIRSPRAVWRRWALGVMFGIGLIAASAPNAIYFRNHPESQHWRRDGVFILQRRNLEAKFDSTRTNSVPDMLKAYAWPSIGGIMLWPHRGQDYDYASNKIPLMGAKLSILHLLALSAMITCWRRRVSYLLLVCWWVLLMVIGSLLTNNAPYIPRILSIYACGAIMIGWAVSCLVSRARRLGGAWLSLPLLAAACAYSGSIAYDNVRHFFFEFINNTKNPGYVTIPIAFVEFVRRFPPECHMEYWSHKGWQSFGSSTLQLVDTGFSRTSHEKPDPPPPPHPAKRTAYVVKMPDFQEIDEQLRGMFPQVDPVKIKNPYRPELPASHHVYWVDPPDVKPASTSGETVQ